MDNVVGFPDKSLIEEEAGLWIIRLSGDKTPESEDLRALHAWMARSPFHREVFLHLAAQWDDMDLLSELLVPSGPVHRLPARGLPSFIVCLLSPVLLVLAVFSAAKRGLGAVMGPQMAAVSVLLFGACIALSSWVMLDKPTEVNNFYITSVGEQHSSTLEDGTILWLNTNSKIEVDYTEATRRIVLHKGEAHFEVHSNPLRPFEVYVGTRMVRAVGTAFSVYLEDDHVKVTVTEGKVDLGVVKQGLGVDSMASSSPLGTTDSTAAPDELPSAEPRGQFTEVVGSLAAGQSVVLAAESDGELDSIVNHEQQDLERRLSWRKGQLVFAGEHLEEVVKEVSRYTQLVIELDDPKLKSLRIGGQFQVGETDALFDVLESGFGLKVTRLSDQHIKIYEEE